MSEDSEERHVLGTDKPKGFAKAPPGYMTAWDLAKLCGAHPNMVTRLCREGFIRASKALLHPTKSSQLNRRIWTWIINDEDLAHAEKVLSPHPRNRSKSDRRVRGPDRSPRKPYKKRTPITAGPKVLQGFPSAPAAAAAVVKLDLTSLAANGTTLEITVGLVTCSFERGQLTRMDKVAQ